MKTAFAFAIVAVVIATCHCASYSESCSTGPDGQMRCVKQSDPNGNMAGSFASSNGGRGQMAAGAGRPGDFAVNHGRVGY